MEPILQYKFISNETITQDSVGSFDSSLISGVQQVTDVGTYGNTALFDANTIYEMQTVPTTLTNRSARSVSVWIYPTDISTNNTILRTANGSGIHQFHHRSSDQKLNLGNAFTGVISPSVIPLNTWTHVGLTFNGSSSVSMFVNGALVDQNNSMNWNLSNLDMKYIGGNPSTNGAYFDGNMVDFRLYDQDIGSSEMAAIYSSGPDISSMTIDAYTHLVDIAWQAPQASPLSITRVFNSSTFEVFSTTGTSETSGEVRVFDLSPGETHTFNLSVNGTVRETVDATLPAIDQASVLDLVQALNNDITQLPEDAVSEITDSLPLSLTNGDTVDSRISDDTTTTTRDDIIFVDADTSVDSGAYLLPFSVNAGSGQTINLTTPDNTSTDITFDENNSTITVNSNVLTVGDSVAIGNRKLTVFRIV